MTQESVVVWNEQAIGRILACDEFRSLSLAGSKPLYAARMGNEWRVVFAEERSPAYEFVDEIIFDGRQVLFRAARDCGRVVVRGDHEGRLYDDVKELYLFEGEPFYVATRGSSCFTVHGRDEGPRFRTEVELYRENSGLLDQVRVQHELELHGQDRTEPVRRRGPEAGEFIHVLEHPFFAEDRNGKLFVAWGEGEPAFFDDVSDLVGAGDKPLYRARRGSEEMVVWGADQSKPYDQIFSLHVEGAHIIFGTRQERNLYRVSRRIL